MDYELKVYQRVKETNMAPPDYKAVSPLGTSPTITDGDVAMSESNAIIEYILDKAESLGIDTMNMRPRPGSAERIDYLIWFHTSAASFQPLMTVDTIFRLGKSQTPWPISLVVSMLSDKVASRLILPRLQKILQMAETRLSSHDFLAGTTLTAADITSIYSFEACFERMPHFQTEFPTCQKWRERMHERPAFQAALQKLGQEGVSFKDF